jgi:hypothetical protein
MSRPPNEPRPTRPTATSLLFGGRSAADGETSRRARSRVPMRFAVGALSALLVVGTALHIWPAIRAGLHDGTRGAWVATSSECSKRAGCLWHGKFVLSSGRVLIASAQYAGRFPAGLHAGTSLPAIYPGGSGLVFPASGSDLWMSLLAGLIVGLLGLYWASHRWVAGFIRERRSGATVLTGPVGPRP